MRFLCKQLQAKRRHDYVLLQHTLSNVLKISRPYSASSSFASLLINENEIQQHHQSGTSNHHHHRPLFDLIGKAIGINEWSDWYQFTAEEISKHLRTTITNTVGSRTLLDQYNGSLVRALQTVYPEHPWREDLFRRTPRGFWQNRENHRVFFDRLASPEQLNLQHWSDWNYITVDDVIQRGGRMVIKYYGGSLARALREIYPEHPWDECSQQQQQQQFDLSNTKKRSKDRARRERHREVFNRLVKELGFKRFEDWYPISLEQVHHRAPRSFPAVKQLIRSSYGGSLARALQSIYPEFPWQPSKFVNYVNHNHNEDNNSTATATATATSTATTTTGTRRYPRGHWQDFDNRRAFFDNLAIELGIKNLDDWYSVSVDEVRSRPGGAAILNRYYGTSLMRALRAIYPEHPWRAKHQAAQLTPEDKERRNNFLASLVPPTITTASPFDSSSSCGEAAGSSSSSSGGGLEIVAGCLKVPHGFWKDPSNHRRFLDKLFEALQLRSMDDWYDVTIEQVHAMGGKGFLVSHYGGSLSRALQTVYPEHPWQLWRFPSSSLPTTSAATTTTTTTTTLDSEKSLLEDYIAALSKELDITHLDDWYRVSTKQIRLTLGRFYALIHRNGGLYLVLKKVYPHHDWQEHKFATTSKTTKQDTPKTTTTTADAEAGEEADGDDDEEPREDETIMAAARARRKKGLMFAQKSSQRWLYLMAKKLFPGEEILEDYHHPDLVFFGCSFSSPNHQQQQRRMELDVFLPSLSLAFEYQGEQHYSYSPPNHDDSNNNRKTRTAATTTTARSSTSGYFQYVHPLGSDRLAKAQQHLQHLRDEEKREACARAGIILVSVPYWWDSSPESLAALVRSELVLLRGEDNNDSYNHNNSKSKIEAYLKAFFAQQDRKTFQQQQRQQH